MRRAAGCAGGRGRTRATLLVGLAGAVTGLLPPVPALAAPGATGPADADATGPVEVTVGRLEPRTVTPGATIEVSGTMVNRSDETYTGLSVRLQRGEVLADRPALDDEVADPGETTSVTGPFLDVPGDLEPGDSLSFTYTTTAEALKLTAEGVYPVLVNVNGIPDGGSAERVGELATWLVAQPAAPVERTTVAWLWPLTDRPHRNATGAFADDELAAEVAPGGRLDRAVAVLEQLPRVPGPAPEATLPAVAVTVAVDPALLEELSVMAAGPYLVGEEEGTGTADAADLLERLRAVTADLPVVALPYADVDADALVAVGRSAVVTRTLPGTPEGTARQPVDDDGTADAAPGDPAAGAGGESGTTDGAVPPGEAEAEPTTGAGAAVVTDVLGVEPRTDLAWPAGGSVQAATLDVLQSGGARTVVLSSDGLTDGDAAVGADGDPAAARGGSLDTAAGPVATLVADSRMGSAVADATGSRTGGRLAEQRYLAELAALTTQLDGAQPQTVLVAPPRVVDPDPDTAAAMIADTLQQPWLAPASVEQLAAGPEVDAGELAARQSASPLPAEGVEAVAQSAAVRDDFAGAVTGDPATVLAGYDAAIARASSAEWRGHEEGFAAATTDLRDTLGRLRDQVTLLAPVNGTYSLASGDAPLVLTVRNDLPFAVDVRLALEARGKVGLTTEDIGVRTLEPLSRTTLQVPAHVQQSGGFAVTARLTTPDGGPLGETVQMQVKSTAYGTLTLAITIGAAALLALLFLRRGVRFLLRRRRAAAAEELPVDGVAGVPPTRSPV
ncbi:DUF6049 family protein [Modestobacter marinus]|uniref:DUF6049 family protein n=1 Tax=Modestobacter marinus TaxID=477641 RepID=UPI0021BBF3D4|nr:DUF6049 family protein [Modestobacter marinus]